MQARGLEGWAGGLPVGTPQQRLDAQVQFFGWNGLVR
jgi:hypothetical protein